jgi:hypothetical protein
MKQFTMIDSKDTAKFRVESVRVAWVVDESPVLSHLEQDYADVENVEERERYLREDRARLAGYGDSWTMEGCVARATVSLLHGHDGSRSLHEFRSPGIYGVESDADSDYRDGIELEQLSELAYVLEEFGVPVSRPFQKTKS